MAAKAKAKPKKKSTKKVKQPGWASELVINKEDVFTLIDILTDLGVPVDPILSAIADRLKAGSPINLEDQKIVARFTLGMVATKNHGLFQDKIFAQVAVESAESLTQANKADIEDKK